jgi:hypothetical protein
MSAPGSSHALVEELQQLAEKLLQGFSSPSAAVARHQSASGLRFNSAVDQLCDLDAAEPLALPLAG